MDFADLKDSIGDWMSHLNEQLNDFFSFIGNKLKNFKNYELTYLTLTKPQYEQMTKMGLYSGEKKVLK